MVCCRILLLTKLLIMRRFILLIAVLSLCSFSYGQTPIADFAIDRLCRTQDVIFTDNTTYGGSKSDLSYRIYWGDGNTSNLSSFPVFHSYSNTGNFTISYVVRSSNGNSDSITRNVTVSQPPSVQYTIQNRCFDSAVTLTDNTTIPSGATLVERRWFFPHDGSTYNNAVINKTFSQPGIYQVSLKIKLSNGCEDSSVRFVNNYSAPTIDFIADNTCGDSALMVIDNSGNTTGGGISSYTWNFGNGDVRTFTDKRDTQFVGYATPGTYNITVTMRSPFGCVSQETKQVTIYSLPTANFTATQACAKTPTQFTNTSLNPTGSTGAYYFWDFGDASSTTDTSTAMNPRYSYTASGTYTTKLVYGINSGCRDSITKSVTVLPIPAPNFSLADEFCEDEQVSIFNLTPGLISNYLYDFGDTTTSTDENPTHTYVNTGVYPVSLTVQGSNGCFETYTDTITINPKATPSFTTSGECQGEPVTFTSTSTVSSGAITNYVWQFGDGRISTGQIAQNTYTNAGVFNVRLRLTTDKNCTIEYTQPFTVKPTPIANFSNTAACLGETTQFTNTTSFALGADSITNFFWDFGDGANSNNEDPTYTYANEGNYDVTLRVIGINGCENSITRQIKVETIPNAGFTATNACVGEPITITNISVNSVAVTTQYDLGNGDTRNGADIQYTYNTPGKYNIIQSVSTAAGCTKTDTQVVPTTSNSNPKYQHFSNHKTTPKSHTCNPVSPKTQKMTILQKTINQYITNIQVQQLLTFAATKVQFAATATHFQHLFSHKRQSNYMIINTKILYFMHFSATATHLRVSKTTQSSHNQSTHHLQQLLSLGKFATHEKFYCFSHTSMLQQNPHSLININPIHLRKHQSTSLFQFLISQLHINHFVSLHFSHFHHQSCAKHIQNQFLSRTRFHSCASANHLRTSNTFNRSITQSSYRSLWIANNTTRGNRLLYTILQSSNHIGRMPTCRYHQNKAICTNAYSLQIFGSLYHIVFCSLLSPSYSSIATSYNPIKQVERYTKRRRTFTRINNPQSSTRPTTNIENFTPTLQSIKCQFNSLLNLWNTKLDSLANRGIFCINNLQNLSNAFLVDIAIFRFFLRNFFFHHIFLWYSINPSNGLFTTFISVNPYWLNVSFSNSSQTKAILPLAQTSLESTSFTFL